MESEFYLVFPRCPMCGREIVHSCISGLPICDCPESKQAHELFLEQQKKGLEFPNGWIHCWGYRKEKE